MIRIDDSLLEEIGLIALPKAERDQLLRQIYETLEMRVGMRLAERMTDQQLDEFERFIDTNDEAGALKWLETNFPDYKQVVADELEKLKGEIKKDSGKILEAMQVQGVAVDQQPAQPGLPASQPSQPAPFSQSVAPAQQQFANPVSQPTPLQAQPMPQPFQPGSVQPQSQVPSSPPPAAGPSVPPPPSVDDQQPPMAA